MSTFRALHILAVILLLPGCALHGTAPIQRDRWPDVVALRPGTAVRVWWPNKTAAQLVEANDTGITVLRRTGPVQIKRAQVIRLDVETGGPDSLRNGALIGAAIGTGYVLVVLSMLRAEVDDAAHAPVMGAVLGGAVGTAVDVLRVGKGTRTVYRITRQ